MKAISLLVIALFISLVYAQFPPGHGPSFSQRNFETITKIYNLTKYPNQLPIILYGSDAVPAGLFTQDVVGRINPVGNFTGFKESIEYFFALAPAPTDNALGVGLGEVVITSFSSECPELAAFSGYAPMIVFDNTSALFGQTVGYIIQQGFWKFDSTGAVIAYDLTLPSFGDTLDIILGNQSDPAVQTQYIELICSRAQLECVGGNQQWPSLPACIADLSSRHYGTFADAWSDTVVCRFLHVVLAAVDPTTHCPHVGPSGGMKCVDYPMARKYVLDNTQLFGSQTPFRCPTRQPPTPHPLPTHAPPLPTRSPPTSHPLPTHAPPTSYPIPTRTPPLPSHAPPSSHPVPPTRPPTPPTLRPLPVTDEPDNKSQ